VLETWRKQRFVGFSLVFTRFLKTRSIGLGLFMTKKTKGHESLFIANLPCAFLSLSFYAIEDGKFERLQ
jgi:hypothetical protein